LKCTKSPHYEVGYSIVSFDVSKLKFKGNKK